VPRVQQASAENLPPTANVDPGDSVRQLWMSRIYQCVLDEYMGAPLCKFPEDLRVYEHLLSATAPQVVVEIGAYGGGSALWFRDRLRTLATYGRVADPLVVTVEIDPFEATMKLDAADPEWRMSIHLVEGDVRDPDTAERVAQLVPEGASTLVIEDSAHTYETTLAALTYYSRFVQPDGFFVVEDGSVDVEELRLYDDLPRGVLPAVADWLLGEQGRAFRVRRDLELYGLTTNPQGYLQRVK
jgi:cephalosporin hydroxylase